MDNPAKLLTWEADDNGLGQADARTLRKSVDTCAYWLEVWNSFVLAGVARPVTLVVAMHDDDDVVVSTDRDNARLRVAVPKALRGNAGLQHEVLAGVLEAVETAARIFPHSPPTAIWQPSTDEVPGRSGAVWEGLEPEEMLLFGRTAGADTDDLAAFHVLDDYVCERVARTHVAEVVDTEGGRSSATWTIAVSDAGE